MRRSASRFYDAWAALVVAYPEDEKTARAVLGDEIFAALHPLVLKKIEAEKGGILGLEREAEVLLNRDADRLSPLLQAAGMPPIATPEMVQAVRDLAEENRKLIQEEIQQSTPNEGGSK